MLETAILIVMVIVSLAIIGLILVQQGKGADMGASFGSGASNTVFGSQGSGNFLTHSTAILAAVFFACCLALAWFGNHRTDRGGGIDFSAPTTPVELKEVPAAADVPNLAPAQPATSEVPTPASVTETPAVNATSAPVVDEKAAAPATEQAPVPAVVPVEKAPEAAPAQEQKTQ